MSTGLKNFDILNMPSLRLELRHGTKYRIGAEQYHCIKMSDMKQVDANMMELWRPYLIKDCTLLVPPEGLRLVSPRDKDFDLKFESWGWDKVNPSRSRQIARLELQFASTVDNLTQRLARRIALYTQLYELAVISCDPLNEPYDIAYFFDFAHWDLDKLATFIERDNGGTMTRNLFLDVYYPNYIVKLRELNKRL